MTKEKTFSVTIDNRKVDVLPGLTILEAARKHAIYIPSLCAREHLPSYGACRLCIVEVDGLRGFLTSCTTPVEEGMVIRTDSAEIRTLRQEILKLLLSEHPGSCLFCGEKAECVRFQGTIRKVGVTTGCRFCPNDERCELQQITEKVGLTEISYPVRYRNFPVENEEPFYDRDYNLCVLCGRCVRICNTVRMNGTLSFKQRGKLTTIGPAFDRSHIEGGCEFCGACVSVCPTGTLIAKTSKWYGPPDGETGTTCPYCSIGCRLMVQVKHGQVIDVLPDYASPVDEGLLCVKGRFGVPEVVTSALRPTEPRQLTPGGYEVISWDRAIDAARERLSAAGPEGFLMLLSPQLSNEDFFAAQQFARKVMKGDHMASPLTGMLGSALPSFLELACASDAFDALDGAGVIIALGFDSRYGYSPLGVRVKRAVERGATLVTLGDLDTNLDIAADGVFKIDSSLWPSFLRVLLSPGEERRKGAGPKADEGLSALFPSCGDALEHTRKALARAPEHVIIVGPEVLRSPSREEVLSILVAGRHGRGRKTIVAHPYTNLSGMVAMGALPGIKPGEALARGTAGGPAVRVTPIDLERHREVVYIIGEACPSRLPPHDYLIYQNGLPAHAALRPDLVLPSALSMESPGTMITVEGRLSRLAGVVEPPGQAKPDWWIIGGIAERMGKHRMGYETIEGVQGEIRKYIRGFPEIRERIAFTAFAREDGGPKQGVSPSSRSRGDGGESLFLLYCKAELETYRGMPLPQIVPGMGRIGNRGCLMINTDDAARLGLAENGLVHVGSDGVALQFPVRVSTAIVAGTVHLIAGGESPFLANPCQVRLRRDDE
jgi:NADH dehydrogenase/NADH:ubiquinone oxidoreductase subunit G